MTDTAWQAVRDALSARLHYWKTMGVDDIPRGTQCTSTMNTPTVAEDDLPRIRQDLGDCTRCRLCEGRTHIVFGVGDPHARLMFIGEGPGADEDAQGEPFVGRAGQLLNKIIAAMGLKREEVYISNVVMCRPLNNRAPLPDEAATCIPFLHRKIAAIRPAIIVCLGGVAARYLLEDDQLKITRVRGRFQQWHGIPVMPTYHPAFLLRNPAAKKEVWDDMKKVLAQLGLPEKI